MSKRTALLPLALGCLIGLASCTTLADTLGVATQEELDAKIKVVKDAGSLLGPWGDLAATGVAALLVVANNARRNQTRKKALASLK